MKCSRCGSKTPKGKHYCLKCHAAYMRSWRKTHKLKGVARMKDIARHYTNVYVKRGKIVKEPCEACGVKKVQAHHTDYKNPLKVKWVCKKHHRMFHVSQN